MFMHCCAAFLLLSGLHSNIDASGESARELIGDNRFQRGVTLWRPAPGRHARYGEIQGFDKSAPPAWGLAQWSSKFPLDPAAARTIGRTITCSNLAKGVIFTDDGQATFAMNSFEEYGKAARKRSDPWAHLLVEQEFQQPAYLARLSSAKLRVEARLLHARNLHQGDYSPDVHAAQFQIFFTVQNRNKKSGGYGDLLWFGAPLFDNRSRTPRAYKAQDFGGTSKYIFTPAGDVFTQTSAHDGKWMVIDRDVLPLMHEALHTGWEHGFLKGSKDVADYAISGMNMGWELPGSFDVSMQVRGLSLLAISK